MVQRCPEGAVQDLSQVQDGHLDGVDDICSLSIVTEAALLHTVRVRSFRCSWVMDLSENVENFPRFGLENQFTYEKLLFWGIHYFSTHLTLSQFIFKNTGLQYGLCCFCVHGLNRFKAPFGQA